MNKRRIFSLLLFLVLLLACCSSALGEGADVVSASYNNSSSSVRVGDVVSFGSYRQYNTVQGAPEPIRWLVLDVQGDKALLVSMFVLDCKPYHSRPSRITWENCTLRTWLNQDFMNKAFSWSEANAILTTYVDNSRAQGYSGFTTDGGNNTYDKIFLLSYAEAWRYFRSDNERMTIPTTFAMSQNVYYHDNGCFYWLRSPGQAQNYAIYVHFTGSRYDRSVQYTNIGVRPAMWVDLNLASF
ncbi:MAG: hypothetical protein IKP40_13265 [Clostridia bacterium]|nr:hypothetical protein [Clostridia bacterium]